jgi:hypothetical protein
MAPTIDGRGLVSCHQLAGWVGCTASGIGLTPNPEVCSRAFGCSHHLSKAILRAVKFEFIIREEQSALTATLLPHSDWPSTAKRAVGARL